MQRSAGLIALLLVAFTTTLHAQDSANAPRPLTVPSELRALLTPKKSETRMIVTRYSADRTLLSGNYAGAEGGRGGGAFNAATAPMLGAEAAAANSSIRKR